MAGIGSNTLGFLQHNPRLLQPRGGMIEAAPIEVCMHFDEHTISEEKLGVAPDRFLQQWHSLLQVGPTVRIVDQIVESAKDGRDAVWGKVLAWEPPTRLQFTWRPGFADETPDTELEVTFTPEGDGTRVELVHSGWEKLEDGAKSRAGYDGGWDGVLEAYRKAI